MSWIFRKTYKSGPFRTTVSKKGIGMSWGIPFFRIGISPTGRKYISIRVPGTGQYYIKYLSKADNLPKEQATKNTNHTPKTIQNNQNKEPWWEQKNL